MDKESKQSRTPKENKPPTRPSHERVVENAEKCTQRRTSPTPATTRAMHTGSQPAQVVATMRAGAETTIAFQ